MNPLLRAIQVLRNAVGGGRVSDFHEKELRDTRMAPYITTLPGDTDALTEKASFSRKCVTPLG